MVNQVDQPEFRRLPRPHFQPYLAELPVELLFHITRYFLGVGRERDVSALARTSKRMHFAVNAELYRLVIKHRTFHIVHWAARKNKIAALKIALEHGADPNQICALGFNEVAPDHYRPVGWGLNTDPKLDRAIREKLSDVLCPHFYQQYFPTSVRWADAWFSAPNLSMASVALLKSLWHHYCDGLLPLGSPYIGQHGGISYGSESSAQPSNSMMSMRDDTGLDELSNPLHDGFAFPEKMSATYMDKRDVKIAFLRLFRFWTTPLHLAALHDNTGVTEALLAKGANVESLGNGVCFCKSCRLPSSQLGPPGNHLVAYTPLHVAICYGNYSTARVLVAHGARQMAKLFSGNDERSWFAENALHTALSIRSDHERFDYDFIEFLLRNGYAAKIEDQNHEGLTPLLLACNDTENLARDNVVKLLLRYGAKLDTQGPRSPQTVVSGPQTVVSGPQTVVSGPRPIGLGENATPALWAARRGEFRLCKLLLDHGADINARSSGSLVTILHAVCSLGNDFDVTQDRADLFDYVLANVSDESLNAFDVRGMTPLSMLVEWNLLVLPRSDTESKLFGMGSRLFGRGADILAGIKEGRQTPFEYMIERALNIYNNGYGKGGKPSQFCNKVLATMQAFRIDQHPDRPSAFLNRFWDLWANAIHGSMWDHPRFTLELASSLVHTLIKGGGISPAEVDSRGNTAMNSFLKYLVNHQHLVTYSNAYGNGYEFFSLERHYRGVFVQSIIAVLQENGAGPHVKNEEGYTAFDYLHEIADYDGPDQERVAFARVMKRLVRSGEDDSGNWCFKFHPAHHLVGILDEENTLPVTFRDQSRWLACEHWCHAHCTIWRRGNGQCECARGPITPSRTFARCDGECLRACEEYARSGLYTSCYL